MENKDKDAFPSPEVSTSGLTKRANLIVRKLYDGVTKVNAINNCAAIKQGDGWILEHTNIPKITRPEVKYVCDELFPCDLGGRGFGTRLIGNTLHGADYLVTYKFIVPVFSYNDGALIIIDYATNIQWNFNLNSQMSGIEATNTQVFAKSIVKRDSLIQNFGAKKFLDIPNKSSYYLAPVPSGTKNAYHVSGYSAVDYIEGSKSKFGLLHEDGRSIDLDYLPYFTVKSGLIMIPENGEIHVYKDMIMYTKFECNFCTRDSKLYSTNSGILLLENKSLYLLNTI